MQVVVIFQENYCGAWLELGRGFNTYPRVVSRRDGNGLCTYVIFCQIIKILHADD